tara:strand:+ start:407 stop:607 length:201 start_codon:yes stop_codon:yes gene_type:complete
MSAVTVNETFNNNDDKEDGNDSDETVHPSKISLALNESSGGRGEATYFVVLKVAASPKISTFGALK